MPRIPAIAIIVPLFAGCSAVEVRLTAYRAAEAAFPLAGSSARIHVTARAEPPEPLLAREVEAKLARQLAEAGFQVGEAQTADYILFCTVEMDAGNRRTGYRRVQDPDEWYTTYRYDRFGRYRVSRGYVSGSVSYIPFDYTVFGKSLALELCDRDRLGREDADDPRGAVVWSCRATVFDERTDLRWLVNPLIVAGLEQFGRDTGREIRTRISADDPRVQELTAPNQSRKAAP